MKSATAEWVRCYYAAYNRRDWEWLGAMMAKDVEWFSAARGERVRGVTAVVSLFQSSMESFPDANVHMVNLHEAGEVAICECTLTRGDDKPGPRAAVRQPTFCEVMQISNGRCLKGSTYSDTLSLLMKLSVAEAAA